MNFKNAALSFILSCGALNAPAYLIGQETAVEAPAGEADECSVQLLRSFFPEKYVSEALEKYNVPQEKRAAIIKGLAARDRQVIRTVEEKASKLNPNPFKDRDPRQRQIGVKLFRETLMQIMTEVFRSQGITDEKQIQDILDDINHAKAQSFRDCIEKHKLHLPGEKSDDSLPQGGMKKPGDGNTSDNDDNKSDDSSKSDEDNEDSNKQG